MTDVQTKERIQQSLARFGRGDLAENGLRLFDALGYRSERRMALSPNTPETFQDLFDRSDKLSSSSARFREWRSVDMLFQLTDDEINTTGQQRLRFDSSDRVDDKIIQSYLVFAVALQEEAYTRGQLAGITREINKLFGMPVMVLFLYGDFLTLAVIRRRLNLRDESRDVMGKVTLIKDISYADPLRAHIDILYDLSFEALFEEFRFQNFVQLHEAWEKRLNSYALTEQFYREIADWYFWAQGRDDVVFPRAVDNPEMRDDERKKQRALFFIRLLTRLIFCWFLQEKRLIPRDLFRERVARDLLIDFAPNSGTYYRAVLQNLFFATLNQEQARRDWRKKYNGSRDGNRGVTNLWRYRDLLADPERLEALLRHGVPFVNGGLFDCLDEVLDHTGQPNERWDDFSEERNNRLCIPNELFFGKDRTVDLSEAYEDPRRKREKVRPLIEILSHYKFTVEENTPLEEEIALDPELLGKVFENLLASYNEDTKSTARKALGAFYTPREIVDYMVDESLIAYLEKELAAAQLTAKSSPDPGADPRINTLVHPSAEAYVNPFSVQETRALIAAIGRVKIIDPACGSGAFPMGALHKLVDLLRKLDPNNESWKRDRLQDAQRYREMLLAADASTEELKQTDERIEDIRHSFESPFHALDFARKLYLIENGIYGVDIQPLACQIAKLRFFIALLVDQRVNRNAANLAVRPLPNLDTKIVAADSLRPVEKPLGQLQLLDTVLRPLQQKLAQVRHEHFNARTPAAKARCRELDEQYRREIADVIAQAGLPGDTAEMLAEWDPYDPNAAAGFFDAEWMFGPEARGGFDIVLGNPPYIRIQTLNQADPKLAAFYKAHYESAKKGNYDLYVVFVEAGLKLLKPEGQLAYILPHKFFNAQYGEPLRDLIASGRHLRHVVHFGDQQVFAGATNYVCLLFLAKAGAEVCRYVRVDNLEGWLRSREGIEATLPARTIGRSEWSFSVGAEGKVIERLQVWDRRLRDVALRMFQGPITSADNVFLFKQFSRATEQAFVVESKESGPVELEAGILKRVVRSGDIGQFFARPEALVLFPYEVKGTEARLYEATEIRRLFPLTWRYLLRNRELLEAREGYGFRDDRWYRFGRTQNLGMWEQPKLMIPYMITRLSAYLDRSDHYYFINVTTGGYGITTDPAKCSLELLCALMNSPVLDFYLKHVSTSFHGGYMAANKQYIEQLPIAPVTHQQEVLMRALVEALLLLNREDSKSSPTSGTLMKTYYLQILNALVYQLYFSDEFRSRCPDLFGILSEVNLRDIEAGDESRRLARLGELFEVLYAPSHPVRAALYALGSLEVVRIIEGQK